MTNWRHKLTGPITKYDYEFRRNRVLVVIIGFAIISYILLSQGFKTIDDLAVAQGTVVSTEVVKERYKGNNYRYTFVFRLDDMNQFLGIFLGSGDNAIKEGEIWNEKLKIGDTLKVYYDNNIITESENITRLIRKIEKENKVIYQTGTKGKLIIGFCMLGIDLLFIGLLIWIRGRYKQSKGRK
jgi:hypothetical protein